MSVGKGKAAVRHHEDDDDENGWAFGEDGDGFKSSEEEEEERLLANGGIATGTALSKSSIDPGRERPTYEDPPSSALFTPSTPSTPPRHESSRVSKPRAGAGDSAAVTKQKRKDREKQRNRAFAKEMFFVVSLGVYPCNSLQAFAG